MSNPWEINLNPFPSVFPDVIVSGVNGVNGAIGSIDIPSIGTGVSVGSVDTNGDGFIDVNTIGVGIGGHGITISGHDMDHNGSFESGSSRLF